MSVVYVALVSYSMNIRLEIKLLDGALIELWLETFRRDARH